MCRTCLQIYLLADGAIDPVCVSCRALWTRDFININLPAAFRNGLYKEHRAKVLVDREIARLPESQEEARVYKNAVQVIKPYDIEVKQIKARCCELPVFIERIAAQKAMADMWDILENNTERYTAWRKSEDYQSAVMNIYRLRVEEQLATRHMNARVQAIYNTTRQYRRVRDDYGMAAGAGNTLATPATPATHAKRTAFIQKCPAPECMGFMSSTWECGLCACKACKDCHEIVNRESESESEGGDDHVCNPDTVKTINALAKEAKSCPSCAALISKIDGCDQMWCTQCKTAFSWRTGAIETVVIHNPHYFHWMRETGQTIPRMGGGHQHDPCNINNRLNLQFITLRQTLQQQTHEATTEATTEDGPIVNPKETALNALLGHHRYLAHIRAVDIVQIARNIRNYDENEWRRVLRVRRLVQEIDDVEWKTILQRKEKEYHKERSRLHLLEMYVNAGTDILATLLEDVPIETVYDQMRELQTFTEKEQCNIQKVYNCVRIELNRTTV